MSNNHVLISSPTCLYLAICRRNVRDVLEAAVLSGYIGVTGMYIFQSSSYAEIN